MTALLPGINLKTVICCMAVSCIISYGSCAFYLSLKSNSARLFREENMQGRQHHKMFISPVLLSIK